MGAEATEHGRDWDAAHSQAFVGPDLIFITQVVEIS